MFPNHLSGEKTNHLEEKDLGEKALKQNTKNNRYTIIKDKW